MPDFSHSAPLLAELARSVSEPLPVSNNETIAIDDPQYLLLVERGAVNVFIRETADGVQIAPLTHIAHASAGQAVFGFGADAAPTGAEVVVKGLPSSIVRRVPIGSITEQVALDSGNNALAREVAAKLDEWIKSVAQSISAGIAWYTQVDGRTEPGGGQKLAGTLTAERGVVWLVGDCARAAFLGSEEGQGPKGTMPLTSSIWVEIADQTVFDVKTTMEMLQEYGVESVLEVSVSEFHRLTIDFMVFQRRLQLVDTANQLRESTAWKNILARNAQGELFSLQSRRSGRAREPNALTEALKLVARHEDIDLNHAGAFEGELTQSNIRAYLERSVIRHRRVTLSVTDRWWIGDCGAFLGFRLQDSQPVALIPGQAGRYSEIDPVTGSKRLVTEPIAKELRDNALQLYGSLSTRSAEPAGLAALLGMAGRGIAPDMIRLLLTGLLSGLLTIAPAVGIGILIERIVPANDTSLLIQFSLALIAVALTATLAQVLRGTAVMRIEGRVAGRLGAALMDWVCRMKPSLATNFSAGELGTRLMAFQEMRDRVAGPAVTSFLTAVFLLPSFLVVFLYSSTMGWLLLLFGVVSLAVVVFIVIAQIRPNTLHLDAIRRMSSELLQLLLGITKLQSSRSESAAYATWAKYYKQQKRAEIAVASLSEHVIALGTALPFLAGAFVTLVMVYAEPGTMSVAEFLIVFALTQTFFTAIATLSLSFEAIASFWPRFDEVRPVLAAEIERTPTQDNQIKLEGEVHFDRVTFRYGENDPLILDGVSIHAAPGEFIAIVGESGAGKSTLVKLALGLLEPSSGGVLFDGHDLTRLDPVCVRRQMGTVIQEAVLHYGTVLSNIVGSHHEYGTVEAWEAARLACVDEDIINMPMGMHTAVSENGVTLSGGQRQRLAIATALIRKPRVVLLDEATGWLDAVTQHDVMDNIEKLAATRIVVAHRLSTIKKANRIYMLEAGRVIQEGTFEQLAEAEGPFRELIKRQTI